MTTPVKKKSTLKKSLPENTAQTQDDIVYGHIFDAILEQRLPPNTKLNEEALGEIFGVSRTIIRRALLRLSVEQIVKIRPNRGAVVAAPNVEEAKQVLKAREVLELAITELAVEHATSEQVATLRKLVEEEHAAFDQGDVGRGIRLSGEFHIQLATMANNPPLLSFQRSIVSQTSLIIALYEVGNRGQCSFDEHNQLLDAIEAGEKEKAVALMRNHLGHINAKLALDDEAISNDLHAVFSDVVLKRR
ncbi:GntR family transcriptional regulator [Photobacterium galatheae]|uniref:GntR family transcriptional regulator n=1 Tax=Photobacterium galatheae TaxID=1654360 RepID=A0A066RT36_9GAMM|nr:GntR family transcriptional regulator [Photobacterium galatheae]